MNTSLDRVDAARDARNERDRLRDEARYRRERLELYRARLFGGRAISQQKLRELQRASDGAAARFKRATQTGDEEMKLLEAVRKRRSHESERETQATGSPRDQPAIPISGCTSAREERTRDEKAALLREGYADRARTAPDPPEPA